MEASELTAGTALRRFSYLRDEVQDQLFAVRPGALRAAGSARELGSALGAVLYSPANSPRAAERLLGGLWPSITAMVFCLEDAIADRDLGAGEAQVVQVLRAVRQKVEAAGSRAGLPFIFVRVRTPEHFERLLGMWGDLQSELDGVVAPKIGAAGLAPYLELAASARSGRDRALSILPILEGEDFAMRETRGEALAGLRTAFDAYSDLIPCVRIGGTDLSGLWGLRRPRDFTIYDVGVVRDIIGDVVNVMGREPSPVAISGVVWEFIRDARVFKPRLRETPFKDEFGEQGQQVRLELVTAALDGLLRETLLDRANGLHGKTIIHPSHAAYVDAAHVVSHEEWESARAVLSAVEAGDGVGSLRGGERMNEPKPHAPWARRTMLRAQAFGVLQPEHSFLALLQDPRRG
ncbi:hypothetical protein DSM112329_02682 [Paraconexibacter sp. AEG42_29]|uniref:ATP/GTP-binding protein n=1 Tax=Paraconexibacter sp. AEG42_29 TaxID=2997339 RepID=A0AAU7AW01_9ACTN